MTPEDVLNLQEDLYHYSQQPIFQRYVGGVVGSAHSVFEEKTDPIRNPRHRTLREDSIAKRLAVTMPGIVRTSYAYRVTADMCSVIEFAASQLDETDHFDREMAPTECGFVRFEKPLPIHDARGRLMLIHYMLWGPSAVEIVQSETGISRGHKYGVACCMFNDHMEHPDDYAQDIFSLAVRQGDEDLGKRLLAAVGRWGFIGVDMIEQGEQIGSALSDIDAMTAAFILADGDTPQPHTNTKRYLHAFWLMLNQTLTRTEDEYARKTAVKHAKRVGLPGRVTVVDLRRMEGSRAVNETLVEWSRRWIVRGHWAWRKCGPEHPFAQEYDKGFRCRVWIGMYEKGPEDKPLVVPEKVFNVRR